MQYRSVHTAHTRHSCRHFRARSVQRTGTAAFIKCTQHQFAFSKRRFHTNCTSAVAKRVVLSSGPSKHLRGDYQLAALQASEPQPAAAERELSLDEVDDALDHAASFIAMLPLLRPVDPMLFNPAYEIWTRIAAIPPKYRPELLDRLEDGCLRILWKYSVFRYVWDEEQTRECMGNYSVLDDFPSEADQVYTFLGRVEKCILKAEDRLDKLENGEMPVAAKEYEAEPTGQRFEQFFFLHPETKDLFSRVKMPNWLGIVPWSLVPWYSRADIQLVTTPVKSDAGADITLVYQDDPNQPKALLTDEQVPFWWWPDPVDDMESPHSESERDYMRACGPGVYVGCAYFTPKPGEYEETNFKFFLLVRDPSKDRTAQWPKAS